VETDALAAAGDSLCRDGVGCGVANARAISAVDVGCAADGATADPDPTQAAHTAVSRSGARAMRRLTRRTLPADGADFLRIPGAASAGEPWRAGILPPVPTFARRIAEAIAPSRLGRSFRWLLASTTINNAGDGVALSAGPLLVASQTRDPFLVSLALLSEYLPSLLFGVPAGAIADRVDRKRMVILVNVGRAFVLAVLVATIVTASVSIAIVLIALFVLGTAETLADSAASTILPGIVAKPDLGIANARMQGAFVLTNQLLLPPVGAFMFALGPAIPFAANAAAFVLGAILIVRVVTSQVERTEVGTFRRDMADGVRWLLGNPPMRTLALTIVCFNITFGAAWGVLVLYATERLGMGPVGFGLLTTATAIGGIVGISLYGSLERRFSLADIMRVGLLIETFTHLSLALTTSPVWALGTLVVFGGHEFVWSTTSTAVRQRAVPDELMGRVGGVYRVAIIGGLVIGTPIGGILASEFGITAPFWFAFFGSALLVVLLWREFDNIVHAGDMAQAVPAAAASEPGGGAGGGQ
jgi:MFS family permease